MFQQSAYRLHNEMLDKKINSTHDCQDYIKLFNFSILGVEISRNFTTSVYSARVQYFEKRMAVIIQPLCMSFSSPEPVVSWSRG